jgi:hypothetical protein
MTQDVFIVAIDLGGFTVPALMTYSDDRWRGRPAEAAEAPAATEPRTPIEKVEQ